MKSDPQTPSEFTRPQDLFQNAAGKTWEFLVSSCCSSLIPLSFLEAPNPVSHSFCCVFWKAPLPCVIDSKRLSGKFIGVERPLGGALSALVAMENGPGGPVWFWLYVYFIKAGKFKCIPRGNFGLVE